MVRPNPIIESVVLIHAISAISVLSAASGIP
jgi:hypothetical protein